MKPLDVYSLFDITPVQANGLEVFDNNGQKYMDFYGGHAVISIGHSHPHYVSKLTEQLSKLSFYSNSVQNPLQQEVSDKLAEASNCGQYDLFMCNSGAEANENALKLASFVTGRHKVIAFRKGFHGRTSAAVAATDNKSIHAPINKQHQVDFVDFDDLQTLEELVTTEQHCAVIFECIQGVGGLDSPSTEFMLEMEKLCKKHGVLLIADEVQSGFGRTGKFFAFQHYGIEPRIISIAKGMGNGFPVGGILVHESFNPKKGSLGTTFGGNHLACAATIAVLEVMEKEDLVKNAQEMGEYFISKTQSFPYNVKIKGKGLMIGMEFDFEVKDLRSRMVHQQKMFTGSSTNKNLLRFLPPLNIKKEHIDLFFEGLEKELQNQ